MSTTRKANEWGFVARPRTPILTSVSGLAYNGEWLDYWEKRALAAEAKITSLAGEIDALQTSVETSEHHRDIAVKMWHAAESTIRNRDETIAAQAAALDALDQLLDDMGDDGLCVCQAAKDQAIAARRALLNDRSGS